MSLQPLDDRIVVRPSEAEEKTASGLVIPDTAKEKPQQGEVLAVGPGRRADNTGELIPLDIAVGDKVVYSKYGGTEITIDGEDLLILTGRDVLAKVASSAQAAQVRRARPPRPRGRRQQAGRRRQGHPRAQGPQRGHRQEVRRPDHHQRRRDHRP